MMIDKSFIRKYPYW